MPLIVLEGLDGCGKQTQTKLLYDKLSKRYKTHTIDFPRYQNPSSYLVRQHLARLTSNDPSKENPYACELYYAADRAISYNTEEWASWLEQNHVLISDRYLTASMIYQTAKMPDENRLEFARWVYDLETNKLSLPEPDIVIYTKLDPAISQLLMYARYGNDDSKKDEYEKNLDLQKKCYKTAGLIASEFNWNTVNVDDEYGRLRPISEIHKEILDTIISSGILRNAVPAC